MAEPAQEGGEAPGSQESRKTLNTTPDRRTAGAELPLLPVYALTIFASALLAFWIQPLFTKVVLPRYGGSPAVWTTAALFFQVMLLGGYLYAHMLARLQLRAQVVLHGIVLASALATLPIEAAMIEGADFPPVVSLLAVLALGVGMSFFAVSATAPLLQQWFSRTGHRDASDPYFLYSASNAGSLLALVGYPFFLEPFIGARQQMTIWSIGCALVAALLIACGAGVWRRGAAASIPETSLPAPPLSWTVRLRWMLLAFAPSSLMLGVTQHITSEIAAAPLLWLIPLTIYVLTFVLVFTRRPMLSATVVTRVQPLLVMVLALVWPLNNYASVLVLHLLVFAATAMMCHGELARSRPAVGHLTAFYLCLAIGGAAGGAFNALIAPLAFDSLLEYPLALALACALRKSPANARLSWIDVLPAAALGAIFYALILTGTRPFAHGTWPVMVYLQTIGLTLYLTHGRPVRFALVLLVILLATPHVHSADRVLERYRSFFGVHSVLRDESGKFNVLMHGITVHGAQHLDPRLRLKPTAYYHPDGPLGQLFSVLGRNDGLRRVAAVGMGLGTLACYRAPGREWTFYELDPLVVRIAKDARHFDFLERCAPHARIEVGDGRLSLARAKEGSFDLIVIDTFSSDAIPVHMITREALALYLSRAGENGVVMFHVTNQYLDLVPVLARLAADARVAALTPGPRLGLQLEERLAALPSTWVAMARDEARLAPLAAEEGWGELRMPARGTVWTDDFSNVLSALK